MPFLAPIIGAISTFAGSSFLGGLIVRLGITLLLSIAARALMPKPKLTDRTVTSRQALAPRDMVYGRTRKGGVIVFIHSSGRKNQFLHLVIVLASHRVKSIGAIYFDGELALDAGGIAATGIAATGSISFSAQPLVNSTITINGTVFTFKTSGATGNQINIGANLAATMTALAVVLNASVITGPVGERDSAGAGGVAAATYTGTATALTIVHDTLGKRGNRFTLRASISPASRGTVSARTLKGGSNKGRWEDKVWVEKRLGADDQTAFASLIDTLPAEWSAAHRLAGCAAIYLELTNNVAAFPGGIPNITVDIEGKDDILDPRTATNVYSENPALCLADYMAHPAFGLGAAIGAADGVDTASVIAAANICDELVQLAPGFTEPRYTCNGNISLAESPKTLIEGLLSSMAGRAAMQGGTWRIHAGAYRTPEVTLTSDDVRAGGLVLATRVSQSENFNGVRGQFISPENDWQPDDFPAVASAVYLAEDNGTRKWRDISLPFTISFAMAQRLAKIELERARRQMTVKMAGKLAAWRAGIGETVLLSYDRWGFAEKPFEVVGLSLDLTGSDDGMLLLPELVLRETSPLVYDWDASEEAIYDAGPRTNLPELDDGVGSWEYVWHPFDKQTLDDEFDGLWYDHAVYGTVSNWPTSPFLDKHDYRMRFNGLSHDWASAMALGISLWLEIDDGYDFEKAITAAVSNAVLISGFLIIYSPRIATRFHIITWSINGVTGTATFINDSQKTVRARIKFVSGNLDGGQVHLDHRRNIT